MLQTFSTLNSDTGRSVRKFKVGRVVPEAQGLNSIVKVNGSAEGPPLISPQEAHSAPNAFSILVDESYTFHQFQDLYEALCILNAELNCISRSAGEKFSTVMMCQTVVLDACWFGL